MFQVYYLDNVAFIGRYNMLGLQLTDPLNLFFILRLFRSYSDNMLLVTIEETNFAAHYRLIIMINILILITISSVAYRHLWPFELHMLYSRQQERYFYLPLSNTLKKSVFSLFCIYINRHPNPKCTYRM